MPGIASVASSDRWQLVQLQATLAALEATEGIQNIFVFMHRPTQDDNGHRMKPDKKDTDTKESS